MIALSINLEGDGALSHVDKVEEASAMEVLLLDGGMGSGRPSVTLHLLVDHRHIVAQTSARLFCTAARAIMARHPDLFEGD